MSIDRRTYLAGQALAGSIASQPGWAMHGTNPGSIDDHVATSLEAADKLLALLQSTCKHRSDPTPYGWICIKCGFEDR